ncbi:MAG: hypothetical protein ACR2PL_07665 [Dehalococcoidia bacterium]
MVQVRTDVRERLDYLLGYLTDAWCGLPQVEQAIDGWDIVEQIDYIEEWTPKLGLTRQLQQLIASPCADDDQRAIYEKLQQVMEENRPILDRLRAS